MTDAAGQVSNEATDSARTVDPPQPRVWITRGSSAVGQSGCSHSSCAYLVVNTENFNGGDYRVVCHDNYQGEGSFGGRTYSLPANGSRQLGCYYGYPGYDVWVTIEGGNPGASERLRW